MNNLTVTKSNRLVEARYRLTLEQQRLLLLCIAKVDSQRTTDEIPETFKITANEYAKTFNLDSKNAYRQLEAAVRGLYDRDIDLTNPNKKNRVHMRWVWKVEYHDGEGAASLSFSPDLKPYLAQLSSEFTSYQLSNVCNLKSSYSIRLYELLMQFKKTKVRVITIQEFRELLEIKQEQYPRFADLRRWVIQASVDELNAKTSLIIKWEAIKNRRKFEALSFDFNELN